MKVKRRTPRRGQRGFSLLEAVIAAAVLGIGLVGLARLHISSVQGTIRSEETSRAAHVAREIADLYGTLDFQAIRALPAACGNINAAPWWATSPPTPGAGCRSTGNIADSVYDNAAAFTVPTAGCTAYFDEDGVPDVTNAAWVADPMGGPLTQGDFRVDIRRSAHPDPNLFPTDADPDPNATAVAVLWVWVCWTDERGNVQELATNRIKLEEIN